MAPTVEQQFIERRVAILLRAQSVALAELIREADDLGKEFALRSKGASDLSNLLGAVAELRLLLSQLKGAPVSYCATHADALLDARGMDPFRVLEGIGTFATYCHEHGKPAVGHRYLHEAFHRVKWSKYRAARRFEAKEDYCRLLEKLAGPEEP